MKAPLAALVVLLCAAPCLAEEMKVHRDLPYAEPKNERQMLDVYAPAQGKDLPVVVWIHGGGWRKGDKAPMEHKPQALVDRGFVFVSVNYRFFPQVTLKEMTADVARAILWVHNHAREYGGDPNTLLVMGHSAGAHLAALVCTDNRYLKDQGLTLSIIKGCVPVDVAVYDVNKQVDVVAPARAAVYREVFGDEASAKDLSPAAHVARGMGIPAFLVLCVADRIEARNQSEMFGKILTDAGIPATVFAAEGKTHGTINSELGLPDDKPTQALFQFLDQTLARKNQ